LLHVRASDPVAPKFATSRAELPAITMAGNSAPLSVGA
jgi:hypothetical protein